MNLFGTEVVINPKHLKVLSDYNNRFKTMLDNIWYDNMCYHIKEVNRALRKAERKLKLHGEAGRELRELKHEIERMEGALYNSMHFYQLFLEKQQKELKEPDDSACAEDPYLIDSYSIPMDE